MDAYSVLLRKLLLKSSNGQKRVLLLKKVHTMGFKQKGFIHEYDFY